MLICAEMSGIVTIGASSRPQRERGPDLTPSPKSPKVGAAIPSMNCDIRWAASIFHARMLLMPRDGAIIFADLIGKLDEHIAVVSAGWCRQAHHAFS
jgi:hypothetical protein